MPTKKIACSLIVRPTFEFASQLWDPYRNKANQAAEKTTNKALPFTFNITGLTSFSQLRKDVGIESLRERRIDARFSLFTR